MQSPQFELFCVENALFAAQQRIEPTLLELPPNDQAACDAASRWLNILPTSNDADSAPVMRQMANDYRFLQMSTLKTLRDTGKDAALKMSQVYERACSEAYDGLYALNAGNAMRIKNAREKRRVKLAAKGITEETSEVQQLGDDFDIYELMHGLDFGSVAGNMDDFPTVDDFLFDDEVVPLKESDPDIMEIDPPPKQFKSVACLTDPMSVVANRSINEPSRSENNDKRFMRQESFNEPIEVPPAKKSSFMTAAHKLTIDEAKKGGHRNNPSPQDNGNQRKTLGNTRKKFVPPMKNRESSNSDSGTMVGEVNKKVFGGGSKSEDKNQEPVDERLKSIDPRMVELIQNEIMDSGAHKIQWDDIAGLHHAKKSIREMVIFPMMRPDIFTGLRRAPKGLLLFGPPGTGKTLIGKCIASTAGYTFFSISASSLTSKYIGEGEKMVRALFAVARVQQPSVIFIDEIDSLLTQRTDGEVEASRRIKTEFLIQFDGAGVQTAESDNVLIIGATNRPQEIDEAARRRLIKRFYIPLPDLESRTYLINSLLKKQIHHLTPADVAFIGKSTKGYSGSDLDGLCREAALGPIREIPMEQIEKIALDKVRPMNVKDFEAALSQVRASVSDKDLGVYDGWNKEYGSLPDVFEGNS